MSGLTLVQVISTGRWLGGIRPVVGTGGRSVRERARIRGSFDRVVRCRRPQSSSAPTERLPGVADRTLHSLTSSLRYEHRRGGSGHDLWSCLRVSSVPGRRAGRRRRCGPGAPTARRGPSKLSGLCRRWATVAKRIVGKGVSLRPVVAGGYRGHGADVSSHPGNGSDPAALKQLNRLGLGGCNENGR